MRTTPQTRYTSLLLDARKLGADELARWEQEDPQVQAYVQKNGTPDFILSPNVRTVELIYYIRSVLVQFVRPSPGEASVMGTLTPLPNAVLDNLPQDIRAGTPGRADDDPGADCWVVRAGDYQCRTCCAGAMACVGGCRHASR